MEISDDLLCLFSAQVEKRRGSSVIEIPDSEITTGDVRNGEAYRVALIPADTTTATDTAPTQDRSRTQLEDSSPEQNRTAPTPPVEEGEQRTVDIEDIGEQGDGIARVERGYVIIVPGVETGERVVVEIADVKQNVAFGDVTERKEYYE